MHCQMMIKYWFIPDGQQQNILSKPNQKLSFYWMKITTPLHLEKMLNISLEMYKMLSLLINKSTHYRYMMMPEKKDQWLLFERFKMSLYDEGMTG